MALVILGGMGSHTVKLKSITAASFSADSLLIMYNALLKHRLVEIHSLILEKVNNPFKCIYIQSCKKLGCIWLKAEISCKHLCVTKIRQDSKPSR